MRLPILALIFSLAFSANSKQLKQLSDLSYMLRKEILVNATAKELCSCVYNTGAYKRYGEKEALTRCYARSKIPIPESILAVMLKVTSDKKNYSVKARPRLLAQLLTLFRSGKSRAYYNTKQPQFGCRLK